MKIGDKCPEFKGIDQYGKPFDIAPLLGNKKLVIYFYPKNETKVCTAQACSFRDAYATFQDNNCEVIGISGDSAKSHQKFAEHHSLPFILLSDGDKKIRKTFGVPKDFLGLIPGRYTYIVDENGIIIEIFHDMMNAENHTNKAFEKLKIENL
jgi:peroxiredoxin Q/BCP